MTTKLQKSVFLGIFFFAHGPLYAEPTWDPLYPPDFPLDIADGQFWGQREATVVLGSETDTAFGHAAGPSKADGKDTAEVDYLHTDGAGSAWIRVEHSGESTLTNENRTVNLREWGKVTARATHGRNNPTVSFFEDGQNTNDPAYANIGSEHAFLISAEALDPGAPPEQEQVQISVTSRFLLDFGYAVTDYPDFSWYRHTPGNGFKGILGGANDEFFSILRYDTDGHRHDVCYASNNITHNGIICLLCLDEQEVEYQEYCLEDYRFTANVGDVIVVWAGAGAELHSGAALHTTHDWLSKALFEFEMSILDEYGNPPETEPPQPGSSSDNPFQPLTSVPGDPKVFAPVTVGEAGLGFTQPLWFDPEPTIGFEYRANGLNVTSITLPGPGIGLPAIGDNIYELWLFNPGTEEFQDTGNRIFGGVRFDDLPENVNQLQIRGIEETTGIDQPGTFITGLTFAGPGDVTMTIIPLEADTPTPEQKTLTAIRDSTLRKLASNRNEGINPRLRLTAIGKNRPIIAFDPNEIQSFIGNSSASTKATLTLTVAGNGNNWGSAGREVNAFPLVAEFVEGNGKGAGLSFSERTRGHGLGVTWNCSVDQQISNFWRNCANTWSGGLFNNPTADPVIQTNELNDTDEVSWDVTEDVLAGASSWIIKKTNEWRSGYVYYYSKEGAAASNIDFAPRLILERQ